MYPTDTILKFGFPLGHVSGVKLRVSVLFPVAAAALLWRCSQHLHIGLAAVTILAFSVLLHELAHLLVARSTGGEMEEIDLWPLGGLAEPFGRGYWRDHLQTMLAGPLTNLLLAITCLTKIPVDQYGSLLSPFDALSTVGAEPFVVTACRVAFAINIVLFAANLIPVTPFDTGVLLRTYLTSRFSEPESRDVMVRLGLVIGTLGLMGGFVFDMSSVVAVSAVLVVFHIRESQLWLESVNQNDIFDYEFDERERLSDWADDSAEDADDDEESDAATHSEILERWRVQREQERVELEQEERQREDRQVDEILQKVHVHGRESLSANELHLLNRVSDRYRHRRQQHH